MSNTPAKQLICALADIPDPGTHEFSIGEGEWPLRGFVVHHHGRVRAYVNRCPHAGYMLNWGSNNFFAPETNCSLLICTAHGALFMPDSGQCVAGPCTGKSLRSIEIEIVDGQIYVGGLLPELLEIYWNR